MIAESKFTCLTPAATRELRIEPDNQITADERMMVESKTRRAREVLAKSGSPKEIDTLITEIVSSATTVGARASGRELVLLRGRLVNPVEKDFTTTSNLVDPASLPKEFREKVRRTSELNWSYITIKYAGSLKVPAIAVGDMVSIPRSGRYEMYLLFPLTNQNKTLSLISRSIILVDIALVLLIGLITWLGASRGLWIKSTSGGINNFRSHAQGS